MSISAKISFGTVPAASSPAAVPQAGSPFRIAVLGDFSGRHSRGEVGSADEIAGRKLLRINRDNFDDVMAKLGVQLDVPVGDGDTSASLTFAQLDDFHPDQLHDRVEPVADAYDSDEKSTLLSSVLHHRDFQALESAWRGVYWLLGRVKSAQVDVVLLDISLAELAADLKVSDDLAASGLFQLLMDKVIEGPKSQPCAVFVGHYLFEPAAEHAELLGRLAKLADRASASFRTTLHPKVLDK
jgi:type VI secretion system ImpB/VipA family protein